MTKVIGDVENVLGVRVDGFAQFWAPTTYVHTGVAVIPDADSVPIKAGKFTTTVTPGRCRIRVVVGSADALFDVNVPEVDQIEFSTLLEGVVEYEPAVVSEVARLVDEARRIEAVLGSAEQIEQWVTDADRDAKLAASSATAAGVSRDAAAGSASAARVSQDAAKSSESAAKSAQSAAAGSATTASSKAGEAISSATAAASSASAAKASQDAAKASESSASGSASTASARAGEADVSASAAKVSEVNAKASEDSAAAHAESAGEKAQQLQQGMTEVAGLAWALDEGMKKVDVSASAAKASEDNAKASETAAGQSETNAADSATTATDARDSAQAYAGAAQTQAQAAQSQADLARRAADEATAGVKADSVQKSMLTPALRGELDGKAPATHTHVSADITDAVSYFGSPAFGGKVVKTNPTSGHLHAANNPMDDNHLSRKKYVDDQVATRAPSSHTHTIANVTGLQSALDGKANASNRPPVEVVSALPANPVAGTLYLVQEA